MSEWKFVLTPDAEEDYLKLDGSQKSKVDAALEKLSLNPLSRTQGGYGQELSNKNGINLAGFLKVKLRGARIRIVYDLIEDNGVACIIVIGMREDEKVYKTAARRIEKYEAWIESIGDLLNDDSKEV